MTITMKNEFSGNQVETVIKKTVVDVLFKPLPPLSLTSIFDILPVNEPVNKEPSLTLREILRDSELRRPPDMLDRCRPNCSMHRRPYLPRPYSSH